ncbi:hypothetical protein OSB04_024105 [Centaurea solstitialis]|uniref:Reverse transcriptase domain-containing protein n=1 Tax=Centaurea solstitialis TaxID=347529 RepID=A0AA38ST05_9ASTR|nr:hypothetical protein OSB04_024105 [Centaurea solstitialis]
MVPAQISGSAPVKALERGSSKKTEALKTSARVFQLIAKVAKAKPDVVTTQSYVKHGGTSYLAYVVDSREEKKKNAVEDVPVVCEFPNVFPEDLLGIPPERQVEFRIDMVLGAAPIAKTLYRLAPPEMQRNKNPRFPRTDPIPNHDRYNIGCFRQLPYSEKSDWIAGRGYTATDNTFIPFARDISKMFLRHGVEDSFLKDKYFLTLIQIACSNGYY